jgi:hypothetical protein
MRANEVKPGGKGLVAEKMLLTSLLIKRRERRLIGRFTRKASGRARGKWKRIDK